MFPGFAEITDDQAALVEQLVRARRDAGLSQTAIAARMGTSQSAVARLERGDADVRLSTLQRYAEALDRHVAFGVVERTAVEGSTDDDAAELAGDPLPVPSERPVPERRDPVAVPIVYESGDPLRQLYERRTVVLGGPLDAAMATRIAAELMSLDTDRPVALLVNSPGGPVAEVFAVLDVIALMLNPVNTTCIGRAVRHGSRGPGHRDRAAPGRAQPHRVAAVRRGVEHRGTAVEVARQSEQLRAERARLAVLLAAATGLTVERVVHELDAGTSSTPGEALALHLIDEVAATQLSFSHPSLAGVGFVDIDVVVALDHIVGDRLLVDLGEPSAPTSAVGSASSVAATLVVSAGDGDNRAIDGRRTVDDRREHRVLRLVPRRHEVEAAADDRGDRHPLVPPQAGQLVGGVDAQPSIQKRPTP